MDFHKILNNITFFKTIVSFPPEALSGIVNGYIVKQNYQNVFSFEERGTWILEKQISTKNFTKWILKENSLDLYHCRTTNDEKLSTFILTSHNTKQPIQGQSYTCSDDLYTPKIKFSVSSIIIEWKIIGPHKNGTIVTYYF